MASTTVCRQTGAIAVVTSLLFLPCVGCSGDSVQASAGVRFGWHEGFRRLRWREWRADVAHANIGKWHLGTGAALGATLYQGGVHVPLCMAGPAITDGRFKLIAFDSASDELYDIEADPHETIDLLAGSLSPEAPEAHDVLTALLANLTGV